MKDKIRHTYELRYLGAASSGYAVEGEQEYQLSELNVTVPATLKIRCVYCRQKQNADNDDCQFCGAPLPN